MKYIPIILFLSFALMAQGQVPAGVSRLAEAHVRKGRNPGLVVAAVEGGHARYQGYGQMSRNAAVAPDENTIFELGALAGVFTTTLMTKQAMAGQFNLSDPINAFLPKGMEAPAFHPQRCVEVVIPTSPHQPPQRLLSCTPDPLGEDVCIAFCDLATHTSGLPNSGHGLYDWHPIGTASYLTGPRAGFTREEFFSQLAQYPLKAQPGHSYYYSNIGIALIGHLLSELNDLPFGPLLERELLLPLGMKDTRMQLSPEQIQRLAQGHDSRGKPVEHWEFDGLAPAAGLKSTARDLAAFLSANLKTDGSRLSAVMEQTQQARIDVEFPALLRPTEAGYGWLISRLSAQSNQQVVWMYGGTGGFRAYLGFIRDARIGIVLLSNSSSDIRELGFEMIAQLYEDYRAGGIEK